MTIQPATRDLREVIAALETSEQEFLFQAEHLREKIATWIVRDDPAAIDELTFLRRLKFEYKQAARACGMLRDYRAKKLERDADSNTTVDKRGRAGAVHDDE